jgi:FkbM family methyltransferase
MASDDLIYDLGMNNGDDTAFYLACGFRVLSVDADPNMIAAASRRFKAEIEAKRVILLNVGVAEQTTVAEFWINDARPEWNSFSRELTTRNNEPHHAITIQCRRLDEILAEYGTPSYLKIDIEGNDIICCRQLTGAHKPKYISVEMSEVDNLLVLRDVGYDRFKLISQVNQQAVRPEDPKLYEQILRNIHQAANYKKEDRTLPLRIRRASAAKTLQLAGAFGLGCLAKPYQSRQVPDWKFTVGCSGGFGEDLPGEWLTWKEISYIWHRDWRVHEARGEVLWTDLHATTSAEKV